MARRTKKDNKNEVLGLDKLTPRLRDELNQYLSNKWAPAGYISVDTCPVCSHPERVAIEELIYAQVPPPLVNRFLRERGHVELEQKDIMEHARQHCAVKKAVRELGLQRHIREVAERTAQSVSDSDFLTAIMEAFAKTWDPLLDPIKPADAIRAAKVRNEITGGAKDRELFIALFQHGKPKNVIEGEVESEDDIPVQEQEA
ncbi:MAG: hypothetical protein ACYC3G_00630 [Minisyncoccota bacterium]